MPPHGTSVQREVGVHRAHVLYRAGELSLHWSCWSGTSASKPRPWLLLLHPRVQHQDHVHSSPLWPPRLEPAAFLCHYPPNFTASQHLVLLALSADFYLHLTQHHCRDASTVKPPWSLKNLSGSQCEGGTCSTAQNVHPPLTCSTETSVPKNTDPARGVSEWLSWSWLKTRTFTPCVTPYRLVFCACCNFPWSGPTTTKPGAAFATTETEVQAASSNHKKQNTNIKMCIERTHKWQNAHRLKILMSCIIWWYHN